MSLQNIDIDSVIRRLAERRIEEAMKEGKFDNLPGAGLPIELEPMPADEAARMLWWSVRILRRNGMSDLAVKWMKSMDTMR